MDKQRTPPRFGVSGDSGISHISHISRRRLLLGSAAAAGLAVGAPSSAAFAAANDDEPSDADIGFCADMSVHHVQALAMCQRVLGRNTGGSVQAAAAEVLQNQAMEVGQMRAWLTDWNASTLPPTMVMGWMGAGDGAGMPIAMMPGYATPEELSELSTLRRRKRGRRWLELMRAHHVGGVTMATHAANLATVPKVVRLAAAQAEVQTFEISQYDILLEGEYS